MTTTAELRALLARLDGESVDALESETLECKRFNVEEGLKGDQLRGLRETVVCLANQRGGVILLGVEDRQRTRRDALTGVGQTSIPELRRLLYDGTDPHILVDVEELLEPEARLLAIHVPRGLPPHTTADGVGKIRIGKECRPLTGSALGGLLFAGGARDLTAEPVAGATAKDLDRDQIEALRQAVSEEGRKPEVRRWSGKQLLENLELARGAEVSLAALLLTGNPAALARWAPQREVTFLRYRRATKYEARFDLRGPLLKTLDILKEILASHAQVALVGEAGFGERSIPDFTWQVAREAVVNALVHRDYFLSQSILIELHPDRLVVVSPGGFIGGVTPQNVLRHPPVRRNPLLADVLQAAGLVNRAGLGVDRIYEDLLKLGKGLPRFEADESHVRLTLPLRTHEGFLGFVAEETSQGTTPELDELILLRAVTDRGSLDRWSAAEALQLPDEDAAAQLIALRERGFLASEGRGRGTRYRLERRLSDRLRGPKATNRELPLDEQAVRLRVEAVLAARGRLTNAEVRQISGYSRTEAVRLLQALSRDGLAILEGQGRGAHYRPGPRLRTAARRRREKK